jgi:hypothetical protein
MLRDAKKFLIILIKKTLIMANEKLKNGFSEPDSQEFNSLTNFNTETEKSKPEGITIELKQIQHLLKILKSRCGEKFLTDRLIPFSK